jgi:hypothetical protein
MSDAALNDVGHLVDVEEPDAIKLICDDVFLAEPGTQVLLEPAQDRVAAGFDG